MSKIVMLSVISIVLLSMIAGVSAVNVFDDADFDEDGNVDFDDFVEFADAYGGEGCIWADIDRDGDVDFDDHVLFSGYYEKTKPTYDGTFDTTMEYITDWDTTDNHIYLIADDPCGGEWGYVCVQFSADLYNNAVNDNYNGNENLAIKNPTINGIYTVTGKSSREHFHGWNAIYIGGSKYSQRSWYEIEPQNDYHSNHFANNNVVRIKGSGSYIEVRK